MPESSYRDLKCPAGVKMIEQIALVRLVPTDLTRRDSAQVEPSYVRRREQPRGEGAIVRDRCDHQAWSQSSRDVLLAHGNHAGIWKQEFTIGQGMRGGITQYYRREQIAAPIVDHQLAAASVRRGYVAGAFAIQ